MSVKIITDSGSDLPHDVAEKEGITVLPLVFRFGEEEYLDGVTMSPAEFYKRMDEEEELPKTSQISPYQYAEAFKKATEDGSEAVYISISSGVSGCFQSATLAAQDFDGRVKVYDGKHFCISLRILAEYAKRLADEGKSADEIVALLDKAEEKVRIIAVFNTLDNLKKGGRISSTAAFVGEVLSIKPYLTITDGKVNILGKVRGMKKGYQAMREYIEKEGGIDLSMPFAIAYSGADSANIDGFVEANRDLYDNCEDIPLSYVGATVGTYSGPGAIAIAYFVK
ncbi:MAG: DegV family protein [Erysipelotrichaceae bacterium]|nr:DegV family protein [Erysipelotrichaceae bacterium]